MTTTLRAAAPASRAPTRDAPRRRAAPLVIGGLAAAASAAVVGTIAAFRATCAERRRALAGDALMPDPMAVLTQAVTIGVPPARVWPWLAQLGAGRAGWYSYGRIDDGGRRSAETILPEYQRVAPGDVLPAVPGATDAFIVAQVEPPRHLVLTVPGADGPIVTWAFVLEPAARGRTRLLVRARVARGWRPAAAAAPTGGRGSPLLIERVYGVLGRLPAPLMLAAGGFGHRVMQNAQLHGIRRRAESAERRRHAPT